MAREIEIQLKKSLIGRLPSHVQCANGLGLRKINQVVTLSSTPEILGMVNKISYLIKVL